MKGFMKKFTTALYAVLLIVTFVKAVNQPWHTTLKPIDRISFAQEVVGRYPVDMKRYQDKNMEVSPEGQNQQGTKTASCQLFETFYKEFDRAIGAEHLIYALAANDYEEFTKNQSPKLAPQNFKDLHEKLIKDIPTQERFNALRALLRINDIGKPKGTLAGEIEKRENQTIGDHDKVLTIALEKYPELVPSFNELPYQEKQLIVESLSSKLNIAQYNQAENVIEELIGFMTLSEEAKKIAFWEKFADVAGAAAWQDKFVDGSIMIDPVYNGFKSSYKHLIEQTHQGSAREAFAEYIADRCQNFGLDVKGNSKDFALGCLALRARKNAGNFAAFKEQFEKQSPQVREILEAELNKDGINDVAIKVEYSPAIFGNAVTTYGMEDGTDFAFKLTAHIYKAAREYINASQDKQGVFVIHASALAEAVKNKEQREALEKGEFAFSHTDDGVKISLKTTTALDKLQALAQQTYFKIVGFCTCSKKVSSQK